MCLLFCCRVALQRRLDKNGIVIYYHDFNIYAMQMHLADISSDAEIFKIFPELKEVSAEKNKTICFYAEESKIEKIMKQFLPKEQE